MFPIKNITKERRPLCDSECFVGLQKGDWTISGFFAITGGGGKASFDDGLPMFESAAMAGIFQESLGEVYKERAVKVQFVTPDMYTINSAMDGKTVYLFSATWLVI
mgnify:CR=1 FL=1